MSFDKLEINKVENLEEWDNFVKNSENGNLFSYSSYLKAAEVNFHLWLIQKDNKSIGGAYFLVSECGKNIITDDLIIYSGIIFGVAENMHETKKKHHHFLITDFIANKLPEIYDNIDFCLNPEVVDPRPFQFYGYGNDNIKSYKCNVKFTSYIENLDLNKYEENELYNSYIFNNISPVKKRDIRVAERQDYKVFINRSVDKLIEFYELNLRKQNHSVPKFFLLRMEKLVNFLVKNDKAIIIDIEDKNYTPIYSIVYAWDDKKAYYLYGSGSINTKYRWQGIIAQWEAFKYLGKNTKLLKIDLEGINSPNRSNFKMMLGGMIKPYYNITL